MCGAGGSHICGGAPAVLTLEDEGYPTQVRVFHITKLLLLHDFTRKNILRITFTKHPGLESFGEQSMPSSVGGKGFCGFVIPPILIIRKKDNLKNG